MFRCSYLAALTVHFQAELTLNTHVAVSDTNHNVLEMHSDVSKIQEEIGGNVHPVSASLLQSVNNRRMLTVT